MAHELAELKPSDINHMSQSNKSPLQVTALQTAVNASGRCPDLCVQLPPETGDRSAETKTLGTLLMSVITVIDTAPLSHSAVVYSSKALLNCGVSQLLSGIGARE